jgi:4a-hydroxytetrahydrobiopterin dehydratase
MCAPCRGGEGGVSDEAAAALLAQVPSWRFSSDGSSLERQLTFTNFKQAMEFVNRMADLAEAEGHHPDFTVRYKHVGIRLTTHDVGGLSRNDFILAAKIDRLLAA